MKKLVFVVTMFILSIVNVRAIDIKLEHRNEVIIKKFEEYQLYGQEAYLITPFEEANVLDKQKISNLAYIGTRANSLLEKAVIQGLIWQEVNYGSKYSIYEGGHLIDTKNIESNLLNKLNNLKLANDLTNSNYEVNLFDDLEVNGELHNKCSMNQTCENYENKIILKSFDIPGVQEVKISNIYNNFGNNLVSGTNYYTNEFSIFVNVLGNKVTFNVNNLKIYSYSFDVYDVNGGFIKNINIDNNENTFYYPKNKDILLVDVSDNKVLERLDDIMIFEEEKKDEYEININVLLKNVNLKIESVMVPYEFDKDIKPITNDITIFNSNHEKISNCQEEVCNFSLPMGDYYLINNINNEQIFIELYSDLEMILSNYYIKGLITKEKIDKIVKNNQIYSYEKVNDFYYFDDLIEYDEYEIYIDNEKYLIDLRDYNNFILIKNSGLFYKLKLDKKNGDNDKKDEVILPNETEEVKKEPIDDVIINIPNTGLDVERELIYDFKKKYNYHFKYIIYNFS